MSEFLTDRIRITPREVAPDEELFDLLQKAVTYLVFEMNQELDRVGIIRDGFIERFLGTYAVRETASGLFGGLVKNLAGILEPYSPSMPNELRILQGTGDTALVIPEGWEIVQDETIQNRYNEGTAPNWSAAAIKYVGI